MSRGAVAAVRPARLDEAPAVIATYEWLFAPPGTRPPDWDRARARARLEEVIADARSEALVAEGDGELVGLCVIYLDILSVRFGRRAWVEDLAVAPHRRSEGIGRALLHAGQEWARRRGASHLELDSAEARRDAHRFYEREGAGGRSACFRWELTEARSSPRAAP